MSGHPQPALPAGLGSLAGLVAERWQPATHGDLTRWLTALERLPALTVRRAGPGPTVTVEGDASARDRVRLARALLALKPWRKGPFSLFGLHVDAEWRSDWKWQRVAPHLDSLDGRRVLDVGCGNGYFGWRMLAAGAAEVVGVDPSLLYCAQHQAVSRFLGAGNHVLPLQFEELPDCCFDTVFSMGVVYHRRDPVAHVGRLFRHVRPGGQVVVESLVVEGGSPLVPAGRYARMRNVWLVPTPALLAEWLARAGFADVRVVDVTPTTKGEQRTTRWMPFESLSEALDPSCPSRTVEGHPAPVRAVVTGRVPVQSNLRPPAEEPAPP